MPEQLLSALFLLNLRGTVLFSSVRILRGTIGFSGCLALSLSLSIFGFPNSVSEKILTRPFFSIIFEILVGLFLGIIFSLLMEIVPLLGRFIDTFRGVQFQEQVAPELGARDSKLEIYAGYIVLFIFFQTKVFSEIVLLFGSCTNNLGIGGLRGEDFLDSAQYFSDYRSTLIDLLTKIFYSSLVIVSPLVIFSLCLEIGLSLLMKINSKCSLGLDLSLMRAFAGLAVLPLIVNFSDTWTYLLSDLVKVFWNFATQLLIK